MSTRLHALIVLFYLATNPFIILTQTPPALTTRAFDNQRSGDNVYETKLTVANINGLRRITTFRLPETRAAWKRNR